ncbi:MAG: insulinase family protein [Magnetococcales bacterium]|nr:insulinase family protein [Magnetococcales bacterium]
MKGTPGSEAGKRRDRLSLPWFWVFLGLATIFCSATLQAGDLDYRELTLDNGLQVILLREKRAPVVVVQVWYRVGSVDEEDGQTGLAHMLEHMMFQGTKTLAPEEFSRIVARNGGVDNASTSQDFTYYYIKLGSDHLDLALRMEADRMRNLVLQESKFSSENKVVREERRMRNEATSTARMGEKYQAAAYRVHPYGRPVIGWMADIRNHSVSAMREFYQRYYAPNNATLIVAGDIDFIAAEQRVRHHFSPLPANETLQRPQVPQEPVPTTARYLQVLDPEAKVPVWLAGFLVPTLADTRVGNDPFALEVVATILGGGSSSRLYRRLVTQEKLAVSVHVEYSNLSRDPCLFDIHVTPGKEASLLRIEAIVREELERLGREPVMERELAKTRNSMIAEHVYERDSIQSQAWNMGRAVTSGVDWKGLLVHLPDRVRAVAAADVRRVTARYLSPERWFVGTLLPFPTPKPRRVTE